MTVQDLLDYLTTRNIGPEDYDREHIYVYDMGGDPRVCEVMTRNGDKRGVFLSVESEDEEVYAAERLGSDRGLVLKGERNE